jgi:hypothetical protein
MGASDETRPTLQATLVLCTDIALPIEGIDIGWTNVQAIPNLTFRSTYLLVDGNMGFCVELEDVQSELGFDVHAFLLDSAHRQQILQHI